MEYALITGASKGIGKAIAEELASRKINVLLVARSENLLKEVAENIATKYTVQTAYLAIDLASENASQKIFDWCITNNYNVSILINNAGYGLSGAWENYSLQEHQAMMKVNMNMVIETSYLFVEMLKKHSQSYIVNIASAAAYQSVPGLNIYAATKSFVLSFSRGLNYELRNTSVFVSVACPGATDTNFANRAKATGEKAQKLAKQFNMQPNDVAKTIVEGMFAKKIEIVVGFVNKLGVFLAWILPKKLLEKSAASIYGL